MAIVLTVYDAGFMVLTGLLAKLVKILLGFFKKNALHENFLDKDNNCFDEELNVRIIS
jgi:hypothetical protein